MAARGPEPATIGIDFGASKCCVAAARGGDARVLEDALGHRTTPAWVAFTAERRLVGGAALDQAVVNCTNTVRDVKSVLGRTYDQVKDTPSAFNIRRSHRNFDSMEYPVKYKKFKKWLSPEQIAAMLLAKMKAVAEESLGCPVHQAVISVPASFGHAQRVALRAAAQVAGLEVLQLLNETTAAGVAFADNRTSKTSATIVLVDFGASKLDVSLMEVRDKTVKVLAASGNQNIGGFIVDDFLVRHCSGLIEKNCQVTVNGNNRAMARLRLACEKAKHTLSLIPEARLTLDFLVDDQDVDISVHRKDYNNFLQTKVCSEILKCLDDVLRETRKTKDSIDKVVLVGGSTRIPAVKAVLSDYFGRHKVDQTVNADEAVAQGAALCAAALAGDPTGLQVADVASYDICSSYPRSRNQIFAKNFPIPSQTRLHIPIGLKTPVFFNEISPISRHGKNNLIGKHTFLRYHPGVEICFSLDSSGIFNYFFSSWHPTYGDKKRLYPFYSDRCITQWKKEEKAFQLDTAREVERVEVEFELESLLLELENCLKDPTLLKYSQKRDINKLKEACAKAGKCLEHISSCSPKTIYEQIKILKEAKAEVELLKLEAEKKALEEKAVFEREQLRKANDQKIGLLENLRGLLNDPKLLEYSPQEVQECKKELGSFEGSDLKSTEDISEKMSELSVLQRKIEKLKQDAHKKALDEEEAFKAEVGRLKTKISSNFDLLESIETEISLREGLPSQDSNEVEELHHKIRLLKTSLEQHDRNILDKPFSRSEMPEKLSEIEKITDEIARIKRSVGLLFRDKPNENGKLKKHGNESAQVEPSFENKSQSDQYVLGAPILNPEKRDLSVSKNTPSNEGKPAYDQSSYKKKLIKLIPAEDRVPETETSEFNWDEASSNSSLGPTGMSGCPKRQVPCGIRQSGRNSPSFCDECTYHNGSSTTRLMPNGSEGNNLGLLQHSVANSEPGSGFSFAEVAPKPGNGDLPVGAPLPGSKRGVSGQRPTSTGISVPGYELPLVEDHESLGESDKEVKNDLEKRGQEPGRVDYDENPYSLFSLCPGLEDQISKEIRKCEKCLLLKRVCPSTHFYLCEFYQEFINEIGMRVLESGDSDSDEESTL